MTLLTWMLVLVSQLALVAGQIYLKRAMSRREHGEAGWIGQLVLGITTMTLWFLLWLGAMARVDLSQLMPMEGISPLLIVVGAMIFLRERLDWRGWSGVALTCVGVVLVSMSGSR
jgi:undecaprenyl phosphate-alpha-L-ara4N flippase subunit ArnE